MHRYHTILLDADGTLFDFAAAEAAALREAFARFCLPFSAQALAEYHTINQRLWLWLEEGRITRQQLACRRFEELFARLGLAAPPEEFARCYQAALGRRGDLIPGARETLDWLRERGYGLALITNGTAATQRGRLEISGLGAYFAQVFLSEELGAAKPARAFFDQVYASLGRPDPRGLLVVGDSLTSDIQGANAAGWDSCWLNPGGWENLSPARPTYEIPSIGRLPALLEKLE